MWNVWLCRDSYPNGKVSQVSKVEVTKGEPLVSRQNLIFHR